MQPSKIEADGMGDRTMNLKVKLSAITAGVLALTATVLGGQPKATPSGPHIEVVASRFSFSPNEITIKRGDPVTITVRSTDATHGLVIEALGVRTNQIKKGQPEDLTLTPETAGTFQGKCAHFCGKGHGSMTFTVHVVE
jgi:cytochrome c oxidase subunit II